MFKAVSHLLIVVVLTLLSQLGGLAWLVALGFRRRVAAFVLAYVALSVSALWVAPHFGRTALPCIQGDHLQMQSPLFCMLNRQYVVPELSSVLNDHAAKIAEQLPGTQTRVLDANFPFFVGFPLLPHLSHHDGRKADLAFYYQDKSGYLPGAARSFIGYFAFEDGPTDCSSTSPSLRWDMGWLQSLWPDYQLDEPRMQAALRSLVADPRVGKIFIEPHLKQRFSAGSAKIRFQGCRAARHDDHIHIQL